MGRGRGVRAVPHGPGTVSVSHQDAALSGRVRGDHIIEPAREPVVFSVGL